MKLDLVRLSSINATFDLVRVVSSGQLNEARTAFYNKDHIKVLLGSIFKRYHLKMVTLFRISLINAQIYIKTVSDLLL